jgi:hypothetical protein
MSLTDEGRHFYERIGPHLDGIEEAALEAAGSAAIVRGRLRANVDPFFSSSFGPSGLGCSSSTRLGSDRQRRSSWAIWAGRKETFPWSSRHRYHTESHASQ